MTKQTKRLVALIADYKRFAVVLLAIGSFFYLGAILPSTSNTMMELYMMLGTSVISLVSSIYFFIRCKQFKSMLAELDEPQK